MNTSLQSAAGYSHTKVTYKQNTGFVGRVANSLVGIFVGLALVIGAGALLFYNEGNAVQAARALEEGLRVCVSVDANTFHSENNGRLVHFYGPLASPEALRDPDFGVVVKAARLERLVEMYQWVEITSTTTYKAGDTTREEVSYSYRTEWRSERVRSEEFDNPFRHENPQFPVSQNAWVAPHVTVGKYTISPSLLSQLGNWQQLFLQETHVNSIHKRVPGKQPFVQNGVLHFAQSETASVGDVRITFRYAGSTEGDYVSVVARQNDHSLAPYSTHNGRTIELLSSGVVSAEQMFASEMARNSFQTWMLRLLGWILMLIGFSISTSIVNVLVDWIPLVRNIVGMGMFLINLIMASSLAIVVVALGWIRYRPLIGGILLALAIGVPTLIGRSRGPKNPREGSSKAH